MAFLISTPYLRVCVQMYKALWAFTQVLGVLYKSISHTWRGQQSSSCWFQWPWNLLTCPASELIPGSQHISGIFLFPWSHHRFNPQLKWCIIEQLLFTAPRSSKWVLKVQPCWPEASHRGFQHSFPSFPCHWAGECCLRTSLKMHEAACVTRHRQEGSPPGLTFPVTISLFIDSFAAFSPGVGIDLHSEAPFTCYYNLDTSLNPSRKGSVVQVQQPCEAGHPHGLSTGSESIWPLELINFSFHTQLGVRKAFKNTSVLLKVTSGKDKASGRFLKVQHCVRHPSSA